MDDPVDNPQAAAEWYSEEAATFGDRLAGAREAYGFSQKQLARHLGVKEKTVHAWEDDLAEPRANRLQMLSGVLNVSMRWLLTGEGVGLGEPDAPELPADITDLFTELREIRGQATALAERVGRVEKRLRISLKAKL
ncbi:MAG: helix-turn-helix domain-containing protein [Paracoccaceae bacterium]